MYWNTSIVEYTRVHPASAMWVPSTSWRRRVWVSWVMVWLTFWHVIHLSYLSSCLVAVRSQVLMYYWLQHKPCRCLIYCALFWIGWRSPCSCYSLWDLEYLHVFTSENSECTSGVARGQSQRLVRTCCWTITWCEQVISSSQMPLTCGLGGCSLSCDLLVTVS